MEKGEPNGVRIETRVLGKAEKAVYGDRRVTYGPITKGFEIRQAFVNKWLQYRYGSGAQHLTPYDLAMIDILTKIARCASGKPHVDALVDIAGYAEIAAQVTDEVS